MHGHGVSEETFSDEFRGKLFTVPQKSSHQDGGPLWSGWQDNGMPSAADHFYAYLLHTEIVGNPYVWNWIEALTLYQAY